MNRTDRLVAIVLYMQGRRVVESTIGNMRAYLTLRDEGQSLSGLLWDFVGGSQIDHQCKVHKDVPATTRESDEAAKFFKARGFKFFGSTIIYAHMQACGLFNDHLVTCPCHEPCRKLAAKRVR